MRHLAEKNGLTRAQTGMFLDILATAAYKEAKNGFVLPGLGKLVLVQRKARMGRNPATGEAIKIPAKKVGKIPRCQGVQGRHPGTGALRKSSK